MLDDFVTAMFGKQIKCLVFDKYFQGCPLQCLCAFNKLISPNRNVLTNLYGGILMVQ